jgi:hypothetical protein
LYKNERPTLLVSAYVTMVYAPFGTDDDAWQDRAPYYATPIAADGLVTVPEWVIRNGLNDLEQTADTDFAQYGVKPGANANGAALTRAAGAHNGCVIDTMQ